MKHILIDFIDFKSAYQAVIHFKHRESLTVRSSAGRVAEVVAEYLKPLEARVRLRGRASMYAVQKHLDELTPTEELDQETDSTVYREIL